MLQKKNFVKVIDYYLTEQEKDNKFEQALREYAPSDFTGYCRDNLGEIVAWLQEVMDDKYERISWWLWETEAGKRKDMCKITKGEPQDPDYQEWNILTAEDLYDYIVESQLEELDDKMDELEQEHEETVFEIGRRAQTEGVRFALNEISKINETDKATNNPGVQERLAIYSLIYNQITNHYLQETGLDASSREPLELFTEEGNE